MKFAPLLKTKTKNELNKKISTSTSLKSYDCKSKYLTLHNLFFFNITSSFVNTLISEVNINYKKKSKIDTSSVSWSCRKHRLYLCRGGVRTRFLTNVLDNTLNHRIVRFQSRKFGEFGAPIHCHCTQVHSDSEW